MEARLSSTTFVRLRLPCGARAEAYADAARLLRIQQLIVFRTDAYSFRDNEADEAQEIESGHLDRGPDDDPWITPDLVKRQEHVLDRRHEAYAAIENAEAVMRAELLEV